VDGRADLFVRNPQPRYTTHERNRRSRTAIRFGEPFERGRYWNEAARISCADLERSARESPNVMKHNDGKEIRKVTVVLDKLVNVVV